MSTDPTPATTEEPWLKVTCDGQFTRWLATHDVSLACTTYQTGKLLLLGRKPDGGLSVFERNFARAMGLWVEGSGFWMGTQYQLWRLENVLRPGEIYQDHDRLYVPKVGITTGDLDIHDVAVEEGGRVVFVATKFNCLGTTDDRYSFSPLWRPSFISAIVPEDRCHLNGLAMEGGRCRYVTAVDTADEKEGWRKRRRDGGVLLALPGGEVVADGFSMPHSPRLYRGELWVLNSGTGWIGRVVEGKFEPLAFCPGFMRGLTFAGDYAIVGFSKTRSKNTFGGLAVDEELARRGIESQCGLHVIDVRTGAVAHWVKFEGMVTELYDVAVLPGVARPMAFGFRTEEIQHTIALGDPGRL
ncbi:MAG: TIGR03032 family protein [Chthoniobacteraceae bacterium]